MKEEKFYYCPSCGEIDTYEKCSTGCFNCRIGGLWKVNRIETIESLHTYGYYIQEAKRRYNNPFRWKELFESDELKTNPQFNSEKYNAASKDNYHLYLCPVCAKHHNTFRSREEITCTVCGHFVKLYESKNYLSYYHIKSMVLFGDFRHSREIIIDEELSDTPLFEKEEASKITIDNQYAAKYQYRAPVVQNVNVPKCPTCQSTNIKKISATKRSLYAFAFGVFNKTAQSQFECENCGYKW